MLLVLYFSLSSSRQKYKIHNLIWRSMLSWEPTETIASFRTFLYITKPNMQKSYTSATTTKYLLICVSCHVISQTLSLWFSLSRGYYNYDSKYFFKAIILSNLHPYPPSQGYIITVRLHCSFYQFFHIF